VDERHYTSAIIAKQWALIAIKLQPVLKGITSQSCRTIRALKIKSSIHCVSKMMHLLIS
jgi:hypothetical protein